MIPEWSTNGDLPPGVHFATWQEVEDRLSFNSRRHRMLAGFRQACEELRKAGCRLVYLDGRVIKNEKQYRITKAQIRRFQDAVAELAGQARPSNISARLWEAQREAARSQMEELREQVEAYERLNAGRSKEVLLEGVEDLPKALIRARIAAGMTQEGLARRLGVKPQQVQRYEATEYESASFARILKVVQALGLRMPKAVRLVRNG